jgi:hypothetical protein
MGAVSLSLTDGLSAKYAESPAKRDLIHCGRHLYGAANRPQGLGRFSPGSGEGLLHRENQAAMAPRI